MGWLHDRYSPAPFATPAQSGTYALELGDQHILSPDDSHETSSYFSSIFPLARANEWIWDPSQNSLSFDNQGRFWLHCPRGLTANTEVYVCLGLQGNYSWDHYLHDLYQRTLSTVITVARTTHQHHWADYLALNCMIPTTQDLTALRLSSEVSYSQVLLGLVLTYQPGNFSATLHPRVSMSLLTWLQQLSFCTTFSNMHTFRKADNPIRPPLSQTPLTRCERPRPQRRCVTVTSYSEIPDPSLCQELCDQLPKSLALSYTEQQLPCLPYLPPDSTASSTVDLGIPSNQESGAATLLHEPSDTSTSTSMTTHSPVHVPRSCTSTSTYAPDLRPVAPSSSSFATSSHNSSSALQLHHDSQLPVALLLSFAPRGSRRSRTFRCT